MKTKFTVTIDKAIWVKAKKFCMEQGYFMNKFIERAITNEILLYKGDKVYEECKGNHKRSNRIDDDKGGS